MSTHRRLVFIFPGFEPLSAEANARRFLYGLHRTAPLYDIVAEASEPVPLDVGGALQAASFNLRVAADEPTETTVVVYGLDAVNKAYSAKGKLERTAKGFKALGDFLATGTFGRFMRTSWRYGMFFLFPIVVWAAIAALGVIAFAYLRPWGILWALLGGIAASSLLLFCADRWFHLMLLMDDWSFARDLAYGRNAMVERIMAAVNADVAERIAAFSGDEVLFAAHSLGAVPAVGAIAYALQHQRDMGRARQSFGLMTVGSSLLKIALHPAAEGLRRSVGRVVASPYPWLDVQSVADPISFYRSDPVETLKLGPAGRVRIMRISFRKQLKNATYRRMQLNLFKLHRQFVRAVEKRSAYSFHVILCGPTPFARIAGAKHTGLKSGAAEEQDP